MLNTLTPQVIPSHSLSPSLVVSIEQNTIYTGAMDTATNVTYTDSQTGETYTPEEYWAKRQLESSPGYIVGGYLRGAFDFIFDNIKYFVAKEEVDCAKAAARKTMVLAIKTAAKANNVDELRVALHHRLVDKESIESTSKLLENSLKKRRPNLDVIEAYLEAGVRPRFDYHPYNAPILANNIELCTLLIDFGVVPDETDKRTFLSQFETVDIIRQSPPTFRQALSDLTLEKAHKKIEHEVDAIYRRLSVQLQAAKKQSLIEGKPLLILIGEEHSSLNSLFYELILLHLAKDYQVKALFTEAFSAKTYLEGGWKWGVEMSAEQVAGELDIRKQPIDLHACNRKEHEREFEECVNVETICLPSDWDWVSPEGVEVRNQVMAKEIINSPDSNDKIAIVGAGHMMGLEPLLSSHFHVESISVTELGNYTQDTEYGKRALEFAKSVELKTIDSLQAPGLLFSANALAEKAKAGYQRHQADKKQNAKSASWLGWIGDQLFAPSNRRSIR